MRENAESSKFITQATLVLRNGHLPPPPHPTAHSHHRTGAGASITCTQSGLSHPQP